MTLRYKSLLITGVTLAFLTGILHLSTSEIFAHNTGGLEGAEVQVFRGYTLAILLAGLMSLWLLERLIVSRVLGVVAQLKRICERRDLSMRVEGCGTDEIGTLAASVNATLEALRQSEQRLKNRESEARRSETQYRQTVDSLADMLFVVDRDLRITVCNEPLRRWVRSIGLPPVQQGQPIREAFPFIRAVTLGEYVAIFETGTGTTREERLEVAGHSSFLRTSRIPVVVEGRVEQVITLLSDVSAQREAEHRLRMLSQAVEQSANIVVITDTRGRVEYVNPKFTEVTGYSSEEVQGRGINLLRSGHHDERFYRELWETISSGRNWCGEFCNRRRDGQLYWEAASVSPIRDENGEITHYLAIKEDITQRKHSEERLRIARFTLDRAGDSIFWLDAQARIVDVNEAACTALGYNRGELLAMTIHDIDPTFSPERWKQAWQELRSRKSLTLESRHVTRTGEERCVEIMASLIQYGGQEYNCAIARDVTERRRSEDRYRHAAMHDGLTGLPNRALFTEHLAQTIRRAARNPDHHFAVMFLDFDRFKVINDSLGHQIGDQLLVAISRRLQACVRSEDTVARPGRSEIARLGGDEFVILLDGISRAADAARVAERLHEQMSEAFWLSGHEVHTTVSVGIVLSDPGYERPEDMIRDADTAMYRAKTSGKARHVIFDREMHEEAMLRLRLENDLRKAVDRDECRVDYQAIVSLDGGYLAGFEALVRWDHPERGIVSPADFIPIGEETGLIVPIGKLVLSRACSQLRDLHKRFPDRPGLCINVNLSKRQLIEEDLVRQVAEVLETTGIDPTLLKLEVTESAIMEQAEAVTPVLRQLKSLGVKLAMDDFGTGHSSLSCLHRFPIDVLKIDRAFVSNMSLQNLQYTAIVQAIITLAHNLGMLVVAEGIETIDQLSQLQTLNCDFGQGFYFSGPVAMDHAAELVTRTCWLQRAEAV